MDDSMDSGRSTFVLEFVEFVLRTAPVLEKMIIRDEGFAAVMSGIRSPPFLQLVSQLDCVLMHVRLEIMTIFEVLKLPRLSNKATIELYGGELLFEHSGTSSGSSP
jgi:hypothetical protein